jgi:opacity protein-like surface antigen
MARMLAVLLMSVLFVLVSVGVSSAEPFADLYLGAAFPHGVDFTVTAAGTRFADTANLPTSFTAGGRLGYWFGTPGWFGVALDASFFKSDSDTTEIAVSGLLMLRAPLMTSADFPHGRLQPYIGAGPAGFITRETGTREIAADVPSVTFAHVGLDVRGGITYMITKHIGLFTEYRYTQADTHAHQTVDGIDATAEFKLNTHHALGGVSFRF